MDKSDKYTEWNVCCILLRKEMKVSEFPEVVPRKIAEQLVVSMRALRGERIIVAFTEDNVMLEMGISMIADGKCAVITEYLEYDVIAESLLTSLDIVGLAFELIKGVGAFGWATSHTALTDNAKAFKNTPFVLDEDELWTAAYRRGSPSELRLLIERSPKEDEFKPTFH